MLTLFHGCRDVWIFDKVGSKRPAGHRKKILIITTHELGKKRKNRGVFENERFTGSPSESRTGLAFGWLTTYECPALIRK